MPSFREAREALLYAFSDNMISGEDFALLYDINTSKNRDFEYWLYDEFKKTSKNRDFEYWLYDEFNLNDISDDDCIAEFRFQKNDIIRLGNELHLPNEIRCSLYNDLCVDSVEALCILLKRLAYPCRYLDMIPRFARPVPQPSMVFNEMMHVIDSRLGFLLQNLNLHWLTPYHLVSFADAIYNQGAALDNVWDFIDGTVRGISRPSRNQRSVYNGHKCKHALKYQLISTPSGITR